MADDSRPDDKPKSDQQDPEIARRQKDFTRRALLRAGWVVPMVTTVNIPSASAQTPVPHNDVHGDSGHVDNIIEHLDVHLDTPVPPHDDHTDHADAPHTDTPPHTDAPHTDHSDHIDVPHTDSPHTDVPHDD